MSTRVAQVRAPTKHDVRALCVRQIGEAQAGATVVRAALAVLGREGLLGDVAERTQASEPLRPQPMPLGSRA